MNGPTVFISYSHRDEPWKDRLVRQLRVLELEGDFVLWDDRQIAAGAGWHGEIEAAMERARVAVLLISADFLISDFIRGTEIPRLLQRRAADDLRIIPLIVHPCAWQGVDWLAAIQCRPRDGRVLSKGRKAKVEEDLAALALEIRDLLRPDQPKSPLRPVGAPADPSQRGLQGLLDKVDHRCKQKLDATLRGGFFDTSLAWRDRRGGPLGRGEETRREHLEAGALAELFVDRNRLAIVAPAGGGKTITLLRLAQDLIARMARPPHPPPPVPVVLGLSSWEEDDRSFADWMAREIERAFSAARGDAAAWIEQGLLLPLLDGLDEVRHDLRTRCALAISAFLARGGGLVVCVRTAAYEELADGLDLQTEVFVEPLSTSQVEARITAAGAGLAGLREAVEGDESLGELARSPLLLSLMLETYESAPAEALAAIQDGTPDERTGRVVRDFITRMETKSGSTLYNVPRTRHALGWLARRLGEERTTRFEIESLQPAWLGSTGEVVLYALVSRAVAGGLLSLLPAVVFDFPFLPCGLAAGAWAGAVDALPFWRVPPRDSARRSAFRAGVRSVLLFLGALSAALAISRIDFNNPAGFSLSFAMIFALVFGARPSDLRGDTRFFEKLRLGWSWLGALAGSAAGVLSVLVFWLLSRGWAESYQFTYLIALPLVVPLGFVLGGLLGGLQGSALKQRKKPNVGLRKIVRSALKGGALLAGALAALLFVYFAAFKLGGQTQGWTGALEIVPFGFLAGFYYTAFWLGGIDALQHFLLRFSLSATGRFPWRWIRFLRHAVDRGLLEQAAGGWEFRHARVRDGMAALAGMTAVDEDPED